MKANKSKAMIKGKVETSGEIIWHLFRKNDPNKLDRYNF